MRRSSLAAVIALALTGCETPFSPLLPAGPQAVATATVGWWIIGLFLVVIVVMAGLVLVGALRRRGTLAEHLPIDVDGGKEWILIGGVAVPVVVLTALFLVTVTMLRAVPAPPEQAEMEIEVVGHQWWWEITYLDDDLQQRFHTANELHIPVGRKVLIHLKTADVIHSFWVPRLHGKLDLIPGHTNRMVVEASEPGIYRGECAEFCGVQHAHMRFFVVAHTPDEYEAWAARQRQPARTPTEPRLIAGREAFETYACALCHTIRGTRARGGIGPDLTHIGSRLTIGAGTLPLTRARLQAWIVDAQALKPGIKMPSLDTFDGETLNALAVYLLSLE